MSTIVEREIRDKWRNVVTDCPDGYWDCLHEYLIDGYGEGYTKEAADALHDFDYASAVEIVLNYCKCVYGEVPDYVIQRAGDDNMWYGQLMYILFEHLLRESKTYCKLDMEDMINTKQLRQIRQEVATYMYQNPRWEYEDVLVYSQYTKSWVMKNF